GVLMVGLARAVFMLARQTFLVEITPIHLRARAMSTLGGVHRIGMFIGPFLGAAFIHALGLSGAYWAAVLVMLAAGIVSMWVPDLVPRTAAAGTRAAQPAALALMREHSSAFMTLGLACALVAAVRACRE